jgi:hypothetical protein
VTSTVRTDGGKIVDGARRLTAAEVTNADGSGLLREFAGLQVVIDRPKGSLVRGTLADGTQWSKTWTADYGYFPRTDGGDGQGLDVFLGPNPKSTRVFWTTHKKPSGQFDQLKTFLGFDSKADASALYAQSFPDELRGGPMKETSVALISALLGRAPEEIMAKLQDGQTALFDLSPADVHTPSAADAPAKKPGKADKKKRGGLGRRVHIRADLAPGGRLSVRHMTTSADGSQAISVFRDGSIGLRDVRRVTQGAEVDPAAAGVNLIGPPAWADGAPKKLIWVQLAECGKWAGHPAGPFEMTSKTFSEIVSNFERRGLPVPFDFEHASEADATQGSVPQDGSPAPAWVHRMDNRGPAGLWGLVEWLDKARRLIQSGEYAFLSPAIRFGCKDPVTGAQVGARLTSVALTNQPFLTGLDQLRAAKDAPVDADKFSQIKEVLGLDALATPAEAQARVVSLRDACARSTDGTHDGVLLDDYLQPLGAICGVSSVTIYDLLDVVDTMIAAAAAQHMAQKHGGDQQAADALDTAAWRARSRLTDPKPQMAMTDAEPNKDTTTMADENTSAIALKDAQKKAGDLEVALKDATDKAATAAVALKDVTARADAAEQTVADATAAVVPKDNETLLGGIKRISEENAKLLKEKADREEADLVADVDRTIAHYNLKAEQKADLTEMARGARAAFNRMYPPLTDEQARLLKTIVPPETEETAARGAQPEGVSFTGMTAKVIEEAKKAGKTITLMDAQNEAQRRMQDASTQRRSKV